MYDLSGVFWLVMTVGGVAALGAALAIGLVRGGAVTAEQREASDIASRRLYAEEHAEAAR